MENWALVKTRISRKRNAEGMSLCHLPNLHLLLAQWILRTSEIVFSKADLTSLFPEVFCVLTMLLLFISSEEEGEKEIGIMG